jgi:hypothetical protein
MEDTVISTYFSESTNGRAEVKQQGDAYFVEYYSPNGDLITKENFAGKSLRYVEDAAENWALGIKTILG